MHEPSMTHAKQHQSFLVLGFPQTGPVPFLSTSQSTFHLVILTLSTLLR